MKSGPPKGGPPKGGPPITAIESHTAGEPLRVITSGFPELPGRTILERRRYAKEHHDALRTALMLEPRGHADMYGCILTEPERADSDFGVLFIHNEGFSTMCGHGIIAVSTVVLEAGLFPITVPTTELRIDTPAGLVVAQAEVAGGRVTGVRFRNVPSFVMELDAIADVPGIGAVRYDLAFGGAYYAYVQAADVGLGCRTQDAKALIEVGMAIKRSVMHARTIAHPGEADLGFLYGTIFIGPAETSGNHSRNVCIFAEGEVDRSPTGTGVSGRLAIHYARGEIAAGESIEIESIIGTTFRGRVLEETMVGPYRAIIPEVQGSAFITGRSEFVIDPADPLRDGFLVK